jgi:hypothetical protein
VCVPDAIAGNEVPRTVASVTTRGCSRRKDHYVCVKREKSPHKIPNLSRAASSFIFTSALRYFLRMDFEKIEKDLAFTRPVLSMLNASSYFRTVNKNKNGSERVLKQSHIIFFKTRIIF